MRKLIGVLAAMAVAGCATQMDVPLQKVVTLSSGEMVEMVAFDQKDPSGVNSREAYLFFHSKGELKTVGKSDFSGQGWVNGFMQGGFAGLAQGAGLVGGAALLRPSNTNVNSNNGDGAGASGSPGAGATGAGAGGNIVNNNTAGSKSVAKSNQVQGQIQTQNQKQKAYGGAGGAGGSVNTGGGSISGGTTIKNSFNHNAVDVKGGIKDNTVNF